MITLDFETRPIEDHRPPPISAGCAIRWEDGRMEYLAWGHRTGNNCTKEQATSVLREILNSDVELLFQNAKFDLGVGIHRHGWKMPSWKRLHDTQFLIILDAPYAKDISLKGSAERYLGMPPGERDEVVDWLLANETQAVVDYRAKINAKRSKQATMKDAAKALIWLAPVPLVAKYAIGDVDRTFKLYEHLYKVICEGGMGDAYDLERRTLPHLTALEMRGLRVNSSDLEQVLEKLKKSQTEAAIRIYDKMNSFVDIGSPSLARALAKGRHVSGLARKPVTALARAKGKTEGNISTAKDSLEGATFADPELRELIMYWRAAAYMMSNSYGPWLESADGGSKIYTNWNQTRGYSAGDEGGARTLRFSCAWFMNIANERKLRYDLLPGLEKIVSPRTFILPLEGYDKIICRDWSQQEFRVAAHFENGDLQEAYRRNPYLDMHDHVVEGLTALGHSYPRKKVKVFDLAILYGMGAQKTADGAKVELKVAKMIRSLIKGIIPGLMDLVREVQEVCSVRGYVRTWKGARLPKQDALVLPTGQVIDFGYKLPNHLIQRSSAEMMKEAVCRWHEDGYAAIWPWMMSVHDENNVYSTEEGLKNGAMNLDHIMRVPGFDVPLVSDLAIGPNWGSLEDVKDAQYNDVPFQVME